MLPTKDNRNQNELLQPLQFVSGVGPNRAELLQKLGLRTVADLLFFFPRRYQDFTEQHEIQELTVGQTATVIGTVCDLAARDVGGRHILTVLISQPGGGYLKGVWFNQQFLVSKFRHGQMVQFRGKVGEYQGRLQINHPNVMWIEDPENVPAGKLLPFIH